MKEFTINNIKCAYLKLKHYVYFDNSLYFLRARLAEFETEIDFEVKLQTLTDSLVNNNSSYFMKLYDKIDFRVVPKSFAERKINIEGGLITNKSLVKENKVKKINYFIDCPIELHIASVLWILEEGYKLEEDIGDFNYGYRLAINNDSNRVSSGLGLYKSYISQYPKWRNEAIKKAKSLLDEGKDVAILGLDIKSFFHSVHLNFDELENTIGKSLLTNILKLVYQRYNSLICEFEKGETNDKQCILPIGILSSGILANWYLRKFDLKIIKNLNPPFYGRYVDDKLIVFQNPEINYDHENPINAFIKCIGPLNSRT